MTNRILALALLAPCVAFAQEKRTYHLYDGSSATVDQHGFGWRTDKSGRRTRPFTVTLPGGRFDDASILRQLSVPRRTGAAARVIVTVAPGATAPKGARLLDGGSYVLDVRDNPIQAAARLRAQPGIVRAVPDYYVSSMATEPVQLPPRQHRAAAAQALPPATGLPSNYGLQSSLQAHLNSSGVDAAGAFAEIAQRFGQLPGQGVRITNVSVGDLTDQAMADSGDYYVQAFGPTTVVNGGQRYLDIPSMPLIPTWVASPDGTLDPLGTVEMVDPYLGEVLLDFAVMAPLPHDLQRREAQGDGDTDLLGIAPGADYRLVVPQEPTISNIYAALLAAALQMPRPDVITASLGYGFDGAGFPGRYLEEDPVGQQIVARIVQMGIVVCISANDGTRLYTNTAVGPDGGSAPTNLADARHAPTDVYDVAMTTVPSFVRDSGAIDVGGVTLDDISSAPPQWGGPLARTAAFPATRLNGSGGFSSGFGSRVNISAPSDGIVAFMHGCASFAGTRGGTCGPQSVIPVLTGGTSASAPMTAAAAAIVIQVSRLTGRSLSPLQIRDLLVSAARPVPDAPQSDGHVNVGPALDVTAAVEALLPRPALSIPRLAIAQRRPLGALGSVFVEATDPSYIDLSGQNATAPITLAADVTGAGPDAKYAVVIGNSVAESATPSIRLLPSEIAHLAGVPLVSTDTRSIPIRFEARRRGAVASASATLVFGPTDGTYWEPLAPLAPARAVAGQAVTVRYDLSSVTGVNAPALFVSSIGHFSPESAPIFREETVIPLKNLSGVAMIPASAFKAGAGVYGIGLHPDTTDPYRIGEIAVIRIAPQTAARPDSPLLAGTHSTQVLRNAPKLTVRWDVSAVRGADGAVLEVSAPGPTLRNSYNTFTNANGDRRDDDGVETASTLWLPLGGASGSRELDAAALKLPSSLFYGVRVFATRGGQIAGEASAAAGLEFDDGLTPAGTSLVSFDIGSDGAHAALANWSGFNAADSSVAPYSTSTGTYGAPIVEDPAANVIYAVTGSDPGTHGLVVLGVPWNDYQQRILSFDTRTGAQTGRVDFDLSVSPYLSTGRVDPLRHRAAFLGLDWQVGDLVVPFDLASKTAGAPIAADVGTDGTGLYEALDIDPSSGRAFLTSAWLGDLCVVLDTNVGSVSLDDGSATPPVATDNCTTGIAASGGSLYLTKGPLFSWPNLLPVAGVQKVDEASFSVAPVAPLNARSPMFPAVDPVNHLLLVAFVAGDDFYANNNAMSAVGAFDTRTGERVFYSPYFNFAAAAFDGTVPYLQGTRGIQLDPATRTGWTFGPGGQQIQQFAY